MARIPKNKTTMMPINLFKIELVQDNNIILSHVVPKTELGRIDFMQASQEEILDHLLCFASSDTRTEFRYPETLENISIRIQVIREQKPSDPQIIKNFMDDFIEERALSELDEEICVRLSEIREEFNLTESQFAGLKQRLKESL